METSNRHSWPTTNEWRGRAIGTNGEGMGEAAEMSNQGSTPSGGPDQESTFVSPGLLPLWAVTQATTDATAITFQGRELPVRGAR